jgi:cytochrome b pre-mRNA-processing protein 3
MEQYPNVSFLQQIFGFAKQREPLQPLYAALVAEGRDAFWYREGGVPDNVDGRFDMLSSVMAMALLRLEAEDPAGRRPSVLLTELFVEDMEQSLRQIGIGDYVVGKHVGKLMGALGGRLGAYREAFAEGASLAGPVRRNIFHDAPRSEEEVELVAGRLAAFRARLDSTRFDALLAGRIADDAA